MISGMNKYRVLIVLGLTLFFTGFASKVSAENSTGNIAALWQNQKAMFEKSADSRKTEEAYLDIAEFLINNGIDRSEMLSAAYVYLGMEAESRDQNSDAQWAFIKALQMHPDYIPAADAAISNGFKVGIGPGFSALLVRYKIFFRGFADRFVASAYAGNFAYILQIALILLVITVIIAVFIRLFPLLVNEFTMAFSFIPNPWISALLLICALALLFLTPIGSFGILLICLAVGFLFGSKKSVKALWISWSLLLLIFPMFFVHVFSIKIAENRFARIIDYASTSGYSEPIIEELKMMLVQTDNKDKKAKLHFLLGLLYKRGGYYGDAGNHFKEFTELKPRNPKGYINLGNIAFIAERIKTASEYYRKAEKFDSRNPVVFYNLSKAYLAQFRFDEARDMQKKASRLDPELIERFSVNQTSELERMMIDEGIPDEWLQDEISAVFSNITADYSKYWKPVVFNLSLINTAILWGLITLGGFLLRFVATRVKLSRFCLKCGKAMKPDSKLGGTDYVCVACHMVYFKKNKSSGSVKPDDTKHKSIDWNGILHKLFSCLIPGSGRIYSGKITGGFFLLIPWTVLVAFLIGWKDLIFSHHRVPFIVSHAFIGVIIGFLVIDYIISILWGFKEEEI